MQPLDNEVLRSIVEGAADVVLLLDAEGIVVYANAATAELFGRQSEALLGESFGHVVTAERPTEIQLFHPRGGVVTADIRRTRVMVAGRPFDAVYLRDVTERKLNELALLETSRQLGKRVKEQTCVRRVAGILLRSDASLDKALQEVVEILPQGWQYPEITVARITIGGRVYTSKGFRESAWRQSERVVGDDTGDDGTVEVFYTEERPAAGEGPFLDEERELLRLVAIKLGHALSRRQADEVLLTMNRALRVLSAANWELVRANEEPALLEAFCRVCVDEGGYRMAWVGFAEPDEVKSVRPVAQAGFDDGYLKNSFISWADDDHGKGPTGRAIRTGKSQVSCDFANDPSVIPWREKALAHGYLSSVALPLKDATGPFGALVIYAAEKDVFDDVELRLLEELAEDLAYGIATLRDREQRKIAEEKIAYLAYFDELTGLPNRNQLIEALAQATGRLRSGEQCALLALEVARFGEIQAGIGAQQADELLRQLAVRIQGALGPSERLGRIGGHELVVLLSHGGINSATNCAQRIEQALLSPFQQPGISISVQTCIGIVLVPDHGIEAEALLLCSGMAVRQAKRAETRFEVFSGPNESEQLHHLALITELRGAIETKQLVLHYQPKVDLVTGSVAGVEALVRWPHPTHGLIPPGQFIGIAEQTGLINPLTDMVVDAALLQCSLWREAGFDMPVAVNVSLTNLRDADFMTRVEDTLRHRNVPAEYLQVELTESTLMAEPIRTHDVLNQLSNKGIDIVIDDFGTGYSSLNYVANLPIHMLKIDRSFVIKMLESARTRSVVEATISLARSLGIRTVAEGVEAKEEVEALMAMGCTEIQGYYFSRPVEATALRHWAEEFSLAQYGLNAVLERDPGLEHSTH